MRRETPLKKIPSGRKAEGHAQEAPAEKRLSAGQL